MKARASLNVQQVCVLIFVGVSSILILMWLYCRTSLHRDAAQCDLYRAGDSPSEDNHTEKPGSESGGREAEANGLVNGGSPRRSFDVAVSKKEQLIYIFDGQRLSLRHLKTVSEQVLVS